MAPAGASPQRRKDALFTRFPIGPTVSQLGD
jgi:hypothetical protein